MRLPKAILAASLLVTVPHPAAAGGHPCGGHLDTNCDFAGQRCGVYVSYSTTVACSGGSSIGVTVLSATGSGTITPGLTTVPTNQSVTFTMSFAAGVVANGGLVSAAGCVFVGASFGGETLASGAGSGTLGNCTSGSVSGNVWYERFDLVVRLHGVITVDRAACWIDTGEFGFVPTSFQPTNSYVLSGVLTC